MTYLSSSDRQEEQQRWPHSANWTGLRRTSQQTGHSYFMSSLARKAMPASWRENESEVSELPLSFDIDDGVRYV